MPVRRYDPSADLSESYIFEDFPGLLYNNRIWSVRGGSGSVTIPTSCVGGQAQVRANANNYYELYIARLNFTVARKFSQNWRVKIPNLTAFTSSFGLCGSTSPAYSVSFHYSSAVSANWLLITASASIATTINTGVPVDTNWHEFRAAANTGIITFFIDEVPVGNSTSTIPTGGLAPYCRSTDSGGAVKDTLIDWLEVYGDRI